MSHDCFAKAAVNCVRLLQGHSAISEPLFDSLGIAINGSLASALTHVLSTISFVETECERHADLKRVKFEVKAVIEKKNGLDANIFFNLRGSNSDRGNELLRPLSSWRSRETNIVGEYIRPTKKVCHRSVQSFQPIISSNAGPKRTCPEPQPGLKYDNGSVFKIEFMTAVKCFRFLLDGTGISSHCDPEMQFTMDSLPRRTVQDLLQLSYNEEKKRRNAKVNLTYRDLLPQQLHETGRALLPVTRFSFATGIDPTQNFKHVEIEEVKSSRRMKKITAIAVLCIMLQTQGDGGACDTVLSQFAARGLQHAGCESARSALHKGYRFVMGNCTSNECGMRKAHTSLLTSSSEDVEEVGTAMSFPDLKFLNGKKIHEHEVIVRISECKNPEFKFNRENEISRKNVRTMPPECFLGQCHRGNFLTWNKNLLSRITIMGEMGQDIGTAIYARSMHHYLDEANVEHSLDTLDPAGAILIFDVRLHLNTDEEKTAAQQDIYIFAEWYETQVFNRLKMAHFTNSRPPHTHMQLQSRTCLALLWHKKKIKRRE